MPTSTEKSGAHRGRGSFLSVYRTIHQARHVALCPPDCTTPSVQQRGPGLREKGVPDPGTGSPRPGEVVRKPLLLRKTNSLSVALGEPSLYQARE